MQKQDVFVKHKCPRQQQSPNKLFLVKGHSQGHKVSEEMIKELHEWREEHEEYFHAHFFVRHCKELKSYQLTLSLPIFWQLWFLSATFIFNARGIMASQAYKFSKIWSFLYSS